MADIADRDAAILAALERIEVKLDALAVGASVPSPPLDGSVFADMADPDFISFEHARQLRGYSKRTLDRRLKAEYGVLGVKDGGRWKISRRRLMAPARTEPK